MTTIAKEPRTKSKPVVLVVDDEPDIRDLLTRLNENRGRRCISAGTIEEAMSRFAEQVFDLAIIALGLPDGDGIDLLKRIREIDPTLPVVVLSGYGTISRAVDAMRFGAIDFIEKPPVLKQLDTRARYDLG